MEYIYETIEIMREVAAWDEAKAFIYGGMNG